MAVRDPHHSAASSSGAGRMAARPPRTGSSRTAPAAADTEGADIGVGHDLQAPGPVEVGQQTVGAVDQSVEVQQAGERQIGGDHHGGRDRRRPGPAGQPPGAAEQQAHGRADHGKPGQGGGVRGAGATERA